MSTPRFLAALLAGLAGTAALAQPADGDVPHDGRWQVTIQGEDGSRRTATLLLRDFGGQWVGASGRGPAGRDACAGRKVPVTVQDSTAGTLEFTVWGAQVSPKCPDLTIRTRTPDEGKVFEGTAEPGGTVRLVRR